MKSRILSLVALTAVLLTVALADVVTSWDLLYDCCGSGENPVNRECRYTDRYSECSETQVCVNQEYPVCCVKTCTAGADSVAKK
jgi:hypothetical protein